jgi:hypothetical protein
MINKQTLIDNTTTAWYTYICSADIWALNSVALWQVKRVDNATWSTMYAESGWTPTDEYKFIADNRASLTYSYN